MASTKKTQTKKSKISQDIGPKKLRLNKIHLIIVVVAAGIIGAFLYLTSSAATSCSSGYIPYYRMYKGSVGDHFYTTSGSERNKAVNSYGYKNEGTAACVKAVNTQQDNKPNHNLFTTCPAGYSKFYRFYSKTTKDHLYTTSLTERTTILVNHWYDAEGISACVANQLPLFEQKKTGKICDDGLQPFHRLFSPKTGDHFYTRSLSERDKAAKDFGYNIEGVAACVAKPS